MTEDSDEIVRKKANHVEPLMFWIRKPVAKQTKAVYALSASQ